MKIKIFLSIPILYFLALLQTTGVTPNLILVLLVTVSLFSLNYNWLELTTAFIGGFFLDIFSTNFLGFNVLMLLAATVFIRVILRKYVRIPSFKI